MFTLDECFREKGHLGYNLHKTESNFFLAILKIMLQESFKNGL